MKASGSRKTKVRKFPTILLGVVGLFAVLGLVATAGFIAALSPPTLSSPSTTSSQPTGDAPCDANGATDVKDLNAANSTTGRSQPVLLTAGGPPPQGLDIFQAQNLLTENGMNFFVYSENWTDIETSPGRYNLVDTVINPMTMLVPKYPFKGVLLILKMIDSNALVMPGDLHIGSFDDPVVKTRFLAMLHAIARQPSSKKLTHILLGNEVDTYLTANPAKLDGFIALLKAGIDQIHQEMPGVKVGTITTFASLDNPQLFQTLTQYSDFIDYTYYPLQGWQMRPVVQVPADLNRMAAAAGGKPFAFTEIGYSSSPLASSSEQNQAQFVKAIFDGLDRYRRKNQILFISWMSFADPPPGACRNYAGQQGIGASKGFCAFLNNLGLRTSSDNQAKQAWCIFVGEVARWKM